MTRSWRLTMVMGLLVAGAACSGDDDATLADDGAAVAESSSDEAGGEALGSAPSTTIVPVGDAPRAPVAASAAQLVNAGRSVIRTATLRVVADDVADAADDAVAVAERAGGYLASERSDLSRRASARLTFRVPPESFTRVLDDLAALGRLRGQEVGSDDVTETVVDLEGRVGAARASVERLRVLLGRAADVAQVVAVETELARREGELEALSGQLRSLEGQTDLATVTVELEQRRASAEPPVEEDEDDPDFASGLRTGTDLFTTLLRGGATAMGFALPFLLVALVVAVPARWALRRRTPAPTVP